MEELYPTPLRMLLALPGRVRMVLRRKQLARSLDGQWCRALFDSLTAGCETDTQRLVAVNHAIFQRVHHTGQYPGMIPTREIWERRVGWCDNVSRLLVDLARFGGYRARMLNLVHTDGVNRHVVAEVFYAGAWHLFDPDHGVEYFLPDGTVAGASDLLRDQLPVISANDPWRGSNGVGMEGFFNRRFRVVPY